MLVSKLSCKQTARNFIFLAAVYRKTTSTVILHKTCYKNHVLSMTMVIRFELKIMDQIGTSVSFDIKNGNPPRNAGTLKTIVCILSKLPPGGGGGGVII